MKVSGIKILKKSDIFAHVLISKGALRCYIDYHTVYYIIKIVLFFSLRAGNYTIDGYYIYFGFHTIRVVAETFKIAADFT